METPTTTPARVLAPIALIAAFLVLAIVVTTSLNGGGSSNSGGSGTPAGAVPKSGRDDARPAYYVVQNGDTLIAIARRMRVSIDRIQELNPAVDPQILRSGQKLKLR